ncbi:methyl-accepting chemotaxis protein [bacterium]|nr:methyl-accepting chemotaxis protein [bacterium]
MPDLPRERETAMPSPGIPAQPAAGPTARRVGLRAKLVLLSVLPLVALLAGLLWYLLRTFEASVRLQTEAELRDRVAEAASAIERENATIVAMVRTMATAQASGLFGQRAVSADFARRMLAAVPGAYGAYFGYEKDADGHDRDPANAGLPAGSLDAEGRFLPYWFRARRDAAELAVKPLTGMDDGLWYRGVKNRYARLSEITGIALPGGVSRLWDVNWGRDKDPERYMITEPYDYEGELIVETTWPIEVGERFVGVAGLDRSVSRISADLAAKRPYKSAEFVLVSRRGRVIASTAEPGLVTHRIEETPIATELEGLFRDDDGSFFSLAPGRKGGPERYYVGRLIETGEWRLLMQVDEMEVLAPLVAARNRVLWIAIPGVLLALGLALRTVQRVVHRVAAAAHAADRVAAGDLTVDIGATGSDETGDLLLAVRSMLGSLRQLVGRMQQSSVDLVSTATGVAAAARTQEATVADVGASTSQIAAAVREISATAQDLVGTISDVQEASDQTARLADTGRSSLGDLEGAMVRLAESTGGVSAKLAAISERASNIGSVVTTITKVADQTNLLSLNAAIEAEKAGEAGRGFAVVAREIRRLADQTAVASLDIERIVREMQGSVASGVMEMDRFAEEVRRRVAEAAATGERFAEIFSGVQSLIPRFAAVNEGMQAQAAGARQIDEAMVQLTEVARRSADAVRDLGEAATRLRGAVSGIETEMSRFRTG